MTAVAVRPAGRYRWLGGESTTTGPTAPGPGPGVPAPAVAPAQPGGQGAKWLVHVREFPKGRERGILWGATAKPQLRTHAQGGNDVEITFPATRVNLRVWGDPSREVDQVGGKLYEYDSTIRREIVLGSTADGLDRWRFYPRGGIRQQGGMCTVTARGIVGGLTGDRTIGPPTRKNLLGANSSFEFGNLTNWRLVGPDVTGGVQLGGVDGLYCAWVKGTPNGRNYLTADARLKFPAGTPWWGPDAIAGTAYVKLPPINSEIDTLGLVAVAVTDHATGAVLYPDPRLGDAKSVIVDSDMDRDAWMDDQLVAYGSTPNVPFDIDLHLRLYPTSATQATLYDQAQLLYGEATGTGFPRDRIEHARVLIEDAQTGRGKSSWGVKVISGTPTGVVEPGVWPHADATSLDEAVQAIPGVEVHDAPEHGRAVVTTARRGAVRDDVVIQPWDVLGQVEFEIDHRTMRNTIRAVSSAGSVWGGADIGVSDQALANGQVLDVVLQGPAGQTPRLLREWALGQLGTLALQQETVSLLVRWEVGMLLDVGDTVRIHQRFGDGKRAQWMRINQMAPDLIGQRGVVIDAGTDPQFRGK